MLAELREYARGHPAPDDAPNVELVIRYLSALNNVFERSLLRNHVRAFDAHGSTLQRMEAGFQFFVQWANEQYPEGKPEGDPKKFFAWQVCTCTLTYVHLFT